VDTDDVGKMKVVGIDLSGPRNVVDTCLVSFEVRGDEIHLEDVREEADDDKIIEAISSLGKRDRINIGIDAPLSYNSNGGDRPSDKELRRLVQSHGGGVGIMPPTMIRMVYLTLRGMALTRMLELLKSQYDLNIVEVHPGACMLLRGANIEDVEKFKRDEAARRNLLDWLEKMGLNGISRQEAITDHYVAACAAALGAWQWSLGKAMWCFPSNPPYHPYDFAC
jgi:predicted nuclease with RNAse H fold